MFGPVRDGVTLTTAIHNVTAELGSVHTSHRILRRRLELAVAMLRAAALREESRGAHWRRDFPTRDTDRDGARATYDRAEWTGSHLGTCEPHLPSNLAIDGSTDGRLVG